MYASAGGTIILRIKQAGSTGVPVASQVPSNWLTAIDAAVAAWNALNYNVKFNVIAAANNTNPSGYINVDYGATAGGTSEIARANYPSSNGGFGGFIRINSTYNLTALTASARKFAIAHELGHAIGMAHTDTYDYSNVHSSIACGAVNQTDANSVFKSAIPYNQPWNDFTVCDKAVLNYYW